MSFNVSRFKLKSLENLKFPLDALFPVGREIDHPEKFVNDDGSVEYLMTAGGGITGTVDLDGILSVTDIGDLTDDGSGAAIDYILVPALEQSTGYFCATLIWESGEHIETITSDEGVVERIPIDV